MNNKKLQKLLRLADIKPINESRESLSSVASVKKAADGKTYAIVRENRKYYIKVTDKTENLTESDFDFIGGVKNKPKYAYNSFSEATRNMNFVFEEINRLNGGEGVNILESDDELLGEKKYVLKTKKKSAPAPEPELDFGSDEKGGGEFDFGGDEGGDFDFGDDSEGFGDDEGEFGDDDEGGDEDFDLEDDEDLDEDDPIKDIQKTTGELGQQLRDVEDISPDMTKWVAKSVMSALDLGELDKSDKKDLIKTIKKGGDDEDDLEGGDEEFDFGGDEEMEEGYDNYMDDDITNPENVGGLDLDMPLSDVDMPIQDKAYLNIDPDVLTGEDLYGPNDDYDSYMGDELEDDGVCTHCQGSGCSHCAGLGYHDVEPMELSDVDMPIQDKGYLNIEPEALSGNYDNYMDDDLPRWDLEGDCPNCVGTGYVGDEVCDWCGAEGLPLSDIDMPIQDKAYLNIDPEALVGEDDYAPGGRMDGEEDDVLYDNYMDDMYEEEFATIEDELGLPPASAEADETDYEHTPMMGESRKNRRTLTEDHLDDRMKSDEQLNGYYEVEELVDSMNAESTDDSTLSVEWAREEGDNIYLNVIENPSGNMLMQVMVDIDGNVNSTSDSPEFADYEGDEDYIKLDYMGENDDNWEKDNDMEMSNPAPAKEPKTKPAPTKPDTDKPSRPSRRPFTPPPHIRPGEEPRPKADWDDDSDVEFE